MLLHYYFNFSCKITSSLPMKLSRFKIPPFVSNYMVSLKHSSTKADLKSLDINQVKKRLILPEITKERIQKLEDITSIAVAYNYVSWTKITIPTLTLMDWSTYELPDFRKKVDEKVVLQEAHHVASKIPASDLYLLESQPRQWVRNLNDYCLSSMLIALLSLKSENNSDNLVFLNPSVLNKLHDLLVGGERISAKEVVERKVRFHSKKYKTQQQDNIESDCYSLLNIDPEQLHSFVNYSEAEQGGLSLALLIGLTFIDLNIFQSPQILQGKK